MTTMARGSWILLLGLLLAESCQIAVQAGGQQPAGAEQRQEKEIKIVSDSALPETYPQAPYDVMLVAIGGVSPLHWRLEKGALPPGIKLVENGHLLGRAERMGEFQFTIFVRDSGRPQSAVQKVFTLRVRSALDLKWKTPAHVNGNRIEGSAEVSNTTPDDIDLTFIVMAVPPNGRATAIGYQHFVLPRATVGKELPFGEMLPRGGYIVHVDAVGEVERRNLIYRDRLQTPSALQVTLGP